MVSPAEEGKPETEAPGLSRQSPKTDRFLFRLIILAFLAVFLYVLKEELSPLLIGVTLFFLLFLARKGTGFEQGVGILVGLLFAVWFLSEVSGLLWPFVISFVIAYLLAPLVQIMERRISRILSLCVIGLLVLGTLSGIGVILIPRVTGEVRELVQHLPAYGRAIGRLYDRVVLLIESYGVGLSAGEIQQWFIEKLPEVGRVFADNATEALKGLTSGVAALLNLLMIPFVTFYVLKDYEKIKAVLRGLLPRRYSGKIVSVIGSVDLVLGQYVRGQVLVCGSIALMTCVGLAISEIRYAVTLGLMAGVMNLVPYVGLAVSLGVTSVVALLGEDPLAALLKVIFVFVIVQAIEGNFLSPRVLGRRVGLHPAWVMFALVVSAHFWGFLGMVIAIPVAAVVNILVTVAAGSYYKSRYYGTAAD